KQNYRRLRNSLFLEQSVAVCHQKTVGRLHWRNQQFLMFLSLTNRCLSYDGTMNTRLSCWIRVREDSFFKRLHKEVIHHFCRHIGLLSVCLLGIAVLINENRTNHFEKVFMSHEILSENEVVSKARFTRLFFSVDQLL